jgi:hypothetical protein
MNGKISGFRYNPRTHIAHFSLYVPKSGGKTRRERTVEAASRDEAVRLWQEFRDELASRAKPQPPPTTVITSHEAAIGEVPTFESFIDTHLEKICARLAPKTLATYRTIADARLTPFFGKKLLTHIHSCDVDDFIALTLKECSPAYVNASVRTLRALINHAVKRHVIAASPLTEKIKYEDVQLPELELNDEERVAFLGAFDDEEAFRKDVACRRREAHVVTSEHFKAPRKFGFGLNPDSDATGEVFGRFRAMKAIFIVGLERRCGRVTSWRWNGPTSIFRAASSGSR